MKSVECLAGGYDLCVLTKTKDILVDVLCAYLRRDFGTNPDEAP